MAEPTFQEVIREALNDRVSQIHTMIPGEVTSVNSSTASVSVQPLIKSRVRTRDGGFEYETLPVIHNVPLAFPQGGSTFIRWSVQAGDPVELRFSEVDFGQYRQTGKLAEPGDDTRHGLGYPIACPCFTGHGSVSIPSGDTVVIEGSTVKLGEDAAAGAGANVVKASEIVAELALLATALSTAVGAGPYTPPTSLGSGKVKTE